MTLPIPDDDLPTPSEGPSAEARNVPPSQPSESSGDATISSTEIEHVIERFEFAWGSTARPDIASYVSELPSAADDLLQELVQIDLEYRLKSSESARVEDYLTRFPQLINDEEFCLQLIRQEFSLRKRTEEQLNINEYLHRFPQWSGRLEELKTDNDSKAKHRFSARLNCPHCHNPIEIVSDSVDEEALCPSCGSTVHLDTGRLLTGDKKRLPIIDQFELIEAVGRGSFGTVYKARDRELQRIVAIKIPRSGVFETDEEEDRFLREARNVAQLHHPGIVAIHSVGRTETFPYLVSEFVDGVTLAEYLKGTRFNIKDAAELIGDISDALQHAHSHGVVHRDLKPSNIMRTRDGRPQIMDFGFAKRDAGEITMTLDGHILGTPAYMSPEQARGKSHEADPRSDVYSIGVILFELLTGELPFRGEVRTLLHQVVHDEPPSPRKLNQQIPRDLETICLKCMAKEPKSRYASARDLADDMQRYLDAKPIIARPVGPIEQSWRWCRRNPVVSSLSAAALLLLTLTAVISTVAYSSVSRLAKDNGALATEATKSAKEEREAKERERLAREQEEREKDAAKKQEKLARRHLYAAHMNMAQAASENGRFDETMRLLNLHRPSAEEEGGPNDLRGFEWFYLERICHNEIYTLKGHTGAVNAVAYSPDGKTLASASSDKTVRLWDATTGMEQLALEGHSNSVSAVAFSPDGMRLASASYDMTVKLWDIIKGAELLTLNGHTSAIYALAFSPKGRQLATASHDRTVRLWDADSGANVFTLYGHTGRVSCVAFSADGHRVASGGDGKIIKLWDTATGKEVLTLNGHSEWANTVAFSHNGQRLASAGGDSTIKIWDVGTGLELLSLRGHRNSINWLIFSSNDRFLASASSDNTVKLWEVTTGSEVTNLNGHSWGVNCVAFNPDGIHLASASSDGTIKVWHAGTGLERFRLNGLGSFVNCLAFHPDGKKLATATRDPFFLELGENWVQTWDAASGQELLAINGRANDAGRSLDDTNDAGDERLELDKHYSGVTAVTYSPDGSRLASAGFDQTVRIWDESTGKSLLTITGHSGIVSSVVYSPDGMHLASASRDGTVKVWNAATGREMLTLKGHSAGVVCVAFSRDGKRLASSSEDASVKLWDAANGHETLTFLGHSNTVHAVAFSPDGTEIASSSEDKSIKLWDPLTGKESRILNGHSGSVLSVAFSPDGKRLVSTATDSLVKIWDVTVGEQLLSVNSNGTPNGVGFFPDGKQLAVFGATVSIWDVRERSEVPERAARANAMWERRERRAAYEEAFKVGTALLEAGKKEDALTYYLSYQQLLAENAKMELNNQHTQKLLAWSYDKIGKLFCEIGQPEKGLDQFRRFNEISKQIVERNPTAIRNHRTWQFSQGLLGTALIELGRPHEAVAHFKQSVELAKENCSRFPLDRLCKVDLCTRYRNFADILYRCHTTADAIGAYRNALVLARELVESNPHDTLTLDELKFAYFELGKIEKECFHFSEARKYYDDAVADLTAFSERTKSTRYEDQLIELKQLSEFCENASRAVLDLDFAATSDKSNVSQLLPLRVQALLGYANAAVEDLPDAIRENWSTGDRVAELFREAILTADKLRTLEPTVPTNLYDAGCCYSHCVKELVNLDVPHKEELESELKTKALETLNAAIAAGWDNADHTASDTDFETLRELPEFKQIYSQVRTKRQQRLVHDAKAAVENVEIRLVNNPNDSQIQNEFALACQKATDLLLTFGQTDAAVGYSLRPQLLLEKRAVLEPGNYQAQETFAQSLHKVGDLCRAHGQWEKTLEQFRRLRDVSQNMIASRPEVISNHQRFQFSHGRIGQALQHLDRWQESVEYIEKTLELAKENSIRFPLDRQCKVNLFWCYLEVGDIRNRQGRIIEAIESYQQSLVIGRDLAESNPLDISTHADLRFAYVRLGNIERQRFQFALAKKYYEDAAARLSAFSARTKLTPFTNELTELAHLIESCDISARTILDLDFAVAQDKSIVSQQLVLRIQSMLAYARDVPNDVPVEVREKWSTGPLQIELFREAIRTADRFRSLDPSTFASLYDAACCFSLCAKGLAKLELPDKDRLNSELQTKALDTLKAAIAAGWANANHTASDPDLEPLRELADFQTILQELRAKPK